MFLSSAFPCLRRIYSALLGDGFAPFTASEVRAALAEPTGDQPDERRQAILAVATVPGHWTGRLREQDAVELGGLADRLPTIVSLYAQGASLALIAGRAGTRSLWRAERAL